jgi:TP901 family phage tail tape measure protein
LEIRAKLSLAVDGFKSGLDSAKKDLQDFGKDGSKVNSKFAKDLRSSFDNLGPNLKREGRGIRREFDGISSDLRNRVKTGLASTWKPLEDGFKKTTAKIGLNSAVIGGFFRNMTKNAADHTKAIDGYIGKNLANRLSAGNKAKIADMRNLTDFEKKVSSSNRRLAKEALRAEFGARDNTAGRAAWLAKNPMPVVEQRAKAFVPMSDLAGAAARKKSEQEYTKWWAGELNKRDQMAFWNSAKTQKALTRNEQQMWKGLLKQREREESAAARQRFATQVRLTAAFLPLQIKEWHKERQYRKLFDKAIANDQQRQKVEFFNSKEFEKSMASTRYALYDIGARFIAFGTGVATVFGEVIKASANFESSFTSVERTTGMVLGRSGGHAEALRQQLIDLSTTMPVSFEQITRVATLGAQMGIAAESVDEFAVTVSKFSAITGISVDMVAQQFGRLGQLLNVNANQFENLSSAIAYTGVNSVATDAEILNMSESIAAAGMQAGFSADEVIGLSAALASLKVRPEEARGVLARLFREMDVQISQAGVGLDDLSKVLGVTSDDAAALWKQDPSGFFNKFLEGAQATGKLNETLVALGITNTREMNVIQRLSQNTGLLASTMADAEKQYLLGTYSSEAYGLVVDDLNSKLTMFQNSLQAMQVAFGDVMSGGLKIVVDALTGLVKMFTALPTGIKVVISLVAAFAAIAAVLFGGLALGIAGLLAMKLALNNLSGAGVQATISFGTFRALLASMAPTTGAAAAGFKLLGLSATTASGGVRTLGMSMKALMVTTGIGAVILGLSMALDAFGQSSDSVQDSALAAGNAMMEAGGGAEVFARALQADQAAIENGAVALGELTLAYSETSAARIEAENQALAVGRAGEVLVNSTNKELSATGKLADGLELLTAVNDSYNDSIEKTTGLTDSVTMGMGANTAAVYLDALSKYKGPEGNDKTFLEEFLRKDDTRLRELAESLGFDFSEFVTAAIESEGGATAYIEGLEDKLNSLNVGYKPVGMTAEETERLAAATRAFTDAGDQLPKELDAYFFRAADGLDGFRVSAEMSEAVIQANSQALQDMGYKAEVADGLVGGLSEALKGYMDAAFSGEAANNTMADSFETFVDGILDVSDGLSGARADTTNWISYMNSAREAAVANGEGFTGSVTRIVTGIQALADAGKDIKKPFEDMRKYLVNAAKGEGFAELGAKIANATDPSQLSGIIQGFIDLQDSTTEAGKKAIAYGVALQGALSVNPELLKILMAAFDGVAKSTGKAQTALERLQALLEKIFKTMTNKIALEASLDSLSQSLIDGAYSFSVYTDAGRSNLNGLRDVIDNLAVSSDGNLQVMANSLASLRKAMLDAGVSSTAAMNIIDMALKATGKKGKTNANEIKKLFNGITSAINDQSKKTKKSLKDWVSDIQSVLSEAFQNRYASTEALDNITSSWNSMGDAARDAAEGITEAANSIARLKADRNILEYQLKVAVRYGDTLRADAIRAQIAEKDQGLTEAANKQNDYYQSIDKTISGNTNSAIKNREQLRNLVQQYNEYLLSLARTGMSNDDLKKKAVELSKQFLTQGKNMGFAEKDLLSYTSAFQDDFTTVINNLPRDVTLTLASTDPVITAIADFVTKANSELAKITVIGVDGKVYTGTDSGASSAPAPAPTPVDTKVKPTAAQIKEYRKDKTELAAYKKRSQTTAVKKFIAARTAEIKAFETKFGKGYKDGGMVFGPGTSTSDSIPAMLSRGEFVIQASAVNKYGPDFLNALNQMRVSMPASTAVSSAGGSSSSVVYLSPEDRQLLRQAIDRPVALYTENTKIAQSANAGNVILAQRGSK